MNRDKFDRFTSTLLEWNRVHNLTGAKSKEEVFANIEDSIYPCRYIQSPDSILDVGTGAGFPGLILAIFYPQARVVLCEPRNKRASFLKFITMELGLDNVEVIKRRVEDYRDNAFELITSRAVTNTNMLLELTKHLQNSSTRYLFYKGEQVFDEIERIKGELNYDIIKNNQRNYLYIKGLL